MKTRVRGPALTLAGAAAIAAFYVGWSGSESIYAARSRPQAIVGDVFLTPAMTPARPATPDPRVPAFVSCSSGDCSAAAPDVISADDVLYGIEPPSEGEPWTDIADAAFGGTLSDIHDGLSGLTLSSEGSIAAPAPEISTAAMVALGVVFLTARRTGRNRWAPWKAPWKAPWRASVVAASG
jgi:hypothetical protein